MVKFSIIIPVYNLEDYLYRCLYSVLNQDYNDFEIILINDGSDDNSLNIIEEFKNQYCIISNIIKVGGKEYEIKCLQHIIKEKRRIYTT